MHELTIAEVADLFITAQRVQKELEAFYKVTATTVTVQDGALAGQTVPVSGYLGSGAGVPSE